MSTSGPRSGGGADVFDLEVQLELLADDGEGGGVLHDDATVPVGLLAGQQDLKRRGQVRDNAKIMHPPIGDQDGPGDPRAGFLGQGFGQFGKGKRSGILVTIADMMDTQFRVRHLRDFGLDGGDRRIGLHLAVAKRLAGAVVHHQDHDVGKVLPFLLLKRGVGQRQHQRRQRQGPQRPARQAAPESQRNQNHGGPGQRPDQRPADQRREDDRRVHCPSLSSRAGTCTWSDL